MKSTVGQRLRKARARHDQSFLERLGNKFVDILEQEDLSQHDIDRKIDEIKDGVRRIATKGKRWQQWSKNIETEMESWTEWSYTRSLNRYKDKKVSIVRNDVFEDMKEVLKEQGERKFKFRCVTRTGTSLKVMYNKSDRFHWIHQGTVWHILPQVFADQHNNRFCSDGGDTISAPSAEEFRGMIAENITGNHYRNKSIKVPTTAGQPVRA